MSQIVCPRCSAKGFLLTISRSAGIDDLSSGDPTGTLECPGCHTTIEFRALTLPIFPHPAIHYPLQRFECRTYIAVARSLHGGKGHMLPSDNGEWVRHADHVQRVEGQAEVLRRRNETIDQLFGKLNEAQGLLKKRTEEFDALTSRSDRDRATMRRQEALIVELQNTLAAQQGDNAETQGFWGRQAARLLTRNQALTGRIGDLEEAQATLRAEKDTLHAQWERQKGIITDLTNKNEELKKKLQVVESQKTKTVMDLARERSDRWMREIREYNAMPAQDPFGASFNRSFQETFQPGRIFYTPFPSHAEVTIRSLNERILEQEKEMAEFRRMHTAAVNDLTDELAACRSNLKQAEQERDQPSDELTGARRENAFLRRDLGKFRDQLDTTQKELAAEKLKLQKFREVLIGLTF